MTDNEYRREIKNNLFGDNKVIKENSWCGYNSIVLRKMLADKQSLLNFTKLAIDSIIKELEARGDL